ncbi:MAG: imidazolonepropionase [Acidimicrobiales bacterium]
MTVTWDLLVTDTAGGDAIAVDDGRIAWTGPATAVPGDAAEVWSVEGRLVTPGLIDCHTHLVFGGDRSGEWEQRLAGATYEELAAAGGGILSTVAATRAASDDELLDTACARAARLASEGVTTIEVKSGYGLDLATELRLLRVARRIPERVPVDVVTTYLGAHVSPPDWDADDYVDFVADQVLPVAAAEGLVDAVDGFCEPMAFTAEQLARVFQRARDLGLPVKLHADQLSDAAGARLAARFHALSADHLEHTSPEGVRAMAEAGTVAVVLPGAGYVLGEHRRPPVEALRAAGVPMAIASDCNPGTSPLVSLLLAMHLGCTRFGLTVDEAWAGVTGHAARALGRSGQIGVLAAGARADLAVWEAERPAQVVYWLGANPCHAVVKAGEVIAG